MAVLAKKKLDHLIHRLTPRKKSTAPAPRQAWRRRTKVPKVPKSKVQVEQAAEKRKDYLDALESARAVIQDEAMKLRERFGAHSVQYYYDAIMQAGSSTKAVREVSAWNAFVSEMTVQLNEGIEDGEKRRKAPELMPAIKEAWKVLKSERTMPEIEEMYATTKTELEKRREMKQTAIHNVPLQAFQDARATLLSISGKLGDLRERTGTETILIAVCPGTDHFLAPLLFYTSSLGQDFINMSLGVPHLELAPQFEAFRMAGLKGAANHYTDSILDVKKRVAQLIHEKLNEVAGGRVPKMFYTNFDDKITAKYGVVVINWPLKSFTSPGDIRSTNKLNVLYNSWSSGATHFRKLTTDEMEAWEERRFEAAMEQTPGYGTTNSESATGNSGGEIGIQDTSTAANPTTTSSQPPVLAPPSHPIITDDRMIDPSLLEAQGPTQPSRPPFGDKSNFLGSTASTATNNGGPAAVKKARKERSDKGKKRGPHQPQAKATATTSA